MDEQRHPKTTQSKGSENLKRKHARAGSRVE